VRISVVQGAAIFIYIAAPCTTLAVSAFGGAPMGM